MRFLEGNLVGKALGVVGNAPQVAQVGQGA